MRSLRRKAFTSRLEAYLQRRDPQGYYVIPARADALSYLANYNDVIVENVDANTIVVRTRSRRKAQEIIRLLSSKGLLADLD